MLRRKTVHQYLVIQINKIVVLPDIKQDTFSIVIFSPAVISPLITTRARWLSSHTNLTNVLEPCWLNYIYQVYVATKFFSKQEIKFKYENDYKLHKLNYFLSWLFLHKLQTNLSKVGQPGTFFFLYLFIMSPLILGLVLINALRCYRKLSVQYLILMLWFWFL